MSSTILSDRAVLRVSGPDARTFLDRLVTCDLDRVSVGTPRFGALLTPQGKIIADFIVHQVAEDGFLLDVPAAVAADLAKRLGLYRLRAKVAVEAASDLVVAVGEVEAGVLAAAPDPRLAALGPRAVVPRAEPAGSAEEAAYHARRIALGVPDGGRDFAYGDAFPHEALMDQLAGVDFDKGCYVGQEVVSRMQHRGTARTRVVLLASDADDVPPGAEVRAGDKVLGRTGSAAGPQALALVRLDRAADALAAGAPVLADGRVVHFAKPAWVRFPYPGEARPAA